MADDSSILTMNPNMPKPKGLVKPGNIDLTKLPITKNEDGSYSTLYGTSFQDEKEGSPTFGKEVLVRGIINDKKTDDINALREKYYKDGQHLGVFDNGDNADVYAQKIHEDWAAGKIKGVKMPDTDQFKQIRTPDGMIHRFPSAATDDQINEALGGSIKPTTPPSTFTKLKGALYDPTIGSIGQGARDLMQEGSRMKGAHEMISGAEKTALPLGAAAAVMNPEVTLPAMAIGAGAQFLGKHLSKGFGAGEDASDLIGDVSGIGGGYAGGLAGDAVGSAIPEGMASRVGPALKAAAPDLSAAALKSTFYHPLSGLRSAARGLVEGGKELFGANVSPPAPPGVPSTPVPKAEHMMNMFSALNPKKAELPVEAPTKGPNIGQLRTALKNGTITPEQFDAGVDKIPGIDAEAKALHKADARTAMAPKAKVIPDEPKKTIPTSHVEKAVRYGTKTLEDYDKHLEKIGHSIEDRKTMVDNLKKDIESKKGDEEGDEKETPKLETPEAHKVEPPERRVQSISPHPERRSGDIAFWIDSANKWKDIMNSPGAKSNPEIMQNAQSHYNDVLTEIKQRGMTEADIPPKKIVDEPRDYANRRQSGG